MGGGGLPGGKRIQRPLCPFLAQRHACGFKLANDGHDTRAIQAYLGHRSIMSTVRYMALTPNRFKNFWKD
jgi:site-specific recombinase XerD